MVYFLGRDVKVAMTTEHEAFGIKYASATLDIRGTNGNALADDDAIPPRPIGLKEAGTAGVAEISTLTVQSLNENDFETTASDSNSYIILYDPDGDSYAIDFETTGGSTYVQTSQAAAATASLKVTLTTSTGDQSAIATVIRNSINADATFSKVFTAAGSGADVDITNAQTGDATDVLRGSAMSSIILVANDTQGVDASNIISDITGIDISIGTVDEDIAYMGQRTALKTEIKNDISLTLTRKKGSGVASTQSHELFAALFNEARCGLLHADGTIDAEINETDSKVGFDNNTTMPIASAGGANFGYRLHLQMKESSEVMTLRNCCITEYGTTMNTDGVTDETITFYANTKPLVGSTPNTALTAKADF